MTIVIIGAVVAIFSAIFAWHQVQISELKDLIEDKSTEIYLIKTTDLPSLEKKDIILETQQFMILKLIDGDLIIAQPHNDGGYIPESPNR